MRFVTISDTHGKHEDLRLPAGDILIHAGDVSMRGEESEVRTFLNWLETLKYRHKILIAGNHDFYFERESDEQIEKILPLNVVYLKDSGTTINGLKIWGSPVTPWFLNWAFNRRRGDPIRRHWDLIPDDTEILITHGPSFRILDTNEKREHLGCKDLFTRIHEIKPKVHVFGHIHEAYGIIEKSGIKYINASVLNEKYELVNEQIVFDL